MRATETLTPLHAPPPPYLHLIDKQLVELTWFVIYTLKLTTPHVQSEAVQLLLPSPVGLQSAAGTRRIDR